MGGTPGVVGTNALTMTGGLESEPHAIGVLTGFPWMSTSQQRSNTLLRVSLRVITRRSRHTDQIRFFRLSMYLPNKEAHWEGEGIHQDSEVSCVKFSSSKP